MIPGSVQNFGPSVWEYFSYLWKDPKKVQKEKEGTEFFIFGLVDKLITSTKKITATVLVSLLDG